MSTGTGDPGALRGARGGGIQADLPLRQAGTGHRVDLVYLPDHGRPALGRDGSKLVLHNPERKSRQANIGEERLEQLWSECFAWMHMNGYPTFSIWASKDSGRPDGRVSLPTCSPEGRDQILRGVHKATGPEAKPMVRVWVGLTTSSSRKGTGGTSSGRSKKRAATAFGFSPTASGTGKGRGCSFLAG